MLTLTDIRTYAEATLAPVAEGAPLDPAVAALVELGVHASVTCLDPDLPQTIDRALAVGATPAQVNEVLALVSGLGVHTLMVGLARPGLAHVAAPLTAEQVALWETFVGDDPYWTGFEAEFPGFLDATLRASPDLFRAFFAYCAVPWTMGTLRALTKELIALATDACPTHRFGPGMRLHLRNAIKLGAGRAAILQTLDIAASAPAHAGVA